LHVDMAKVKAKHFTLTFKTKDNNSTNNLNKWLKQRQTVKSKSTRYMVRTSTLVLADRTTCSIHRLLA